MPLEFRNWYECGRPIDQTIQAVLLKYPNPFAQHVVSVDTLDTSFSDDGSVLRLERLLGVRQSAPRWVQKVCHNYNVEYALIMQLIGGPVETYVREISFLRLPKSAKATHEIVQGSVNLSLNNVVSCTERISYVPHGKDSSIFRQHALIEAKGRFAEGEIGSAFGKRIERHSWDRFNSNAHIGEEGFKWALNKLWPATS